jgi:integrase
MTPSSSRTGVSGLAGAVHSIEQAWLRQPVKQLARLALTTGTRSWGTILGWRRALIPLSQYLADEGIDSPELLDRELFLEYLLSVRDGGASKNALMGVNTAASVLAALKEPNDGGSALLPSLGSPIYLRRGENAVEKTRAPRPYPEDIINSIDTLVLVDERLDETARKMLRFNRWAGARCSELVTLPIDCLRNNGKGGYWVEYLMPKTKNLRRFPLPEDLAELLLQQQTFVRAVYGDQAEYMFPSPARSNRRAGTVEPWSASGFRNAVAASFVRNGITVSSKTGERISGGQIHRYRHTVGTALLNSGWSQHEVAEFLGHVSPTMTAVYAKILDETLNEKSRAFHEQQQIDKPKPTDPQEHPGVERLRSRFTAVLPLGYCQLPAAQQCDFRKNPCLDCSFFDPGGDEFQPVQANHRKQLRLFIADVADDPAKMALNQQALDATEALPGAAYDEDLSA